jgi:hypothetical protein
MAVNIGAFISSQTATICGAFTYSATYSSGLALDSSVFTFTNSVTPSLAIYSTDNNKAALYTIKVIG